MNLSLTKNKLFSSAYSHPLILGIGYVLLLALSILFYRERVFYSDTAYYVFQLVNTENFHFEHGRYGAFVFQLLPLLAIKLHLPLKVIAILYSISLPLFTCMWSGWIYLHKKENAQAFTILVFLLQILTIRHDWFWPVSELIQGLVLMAIGFYYFQQKRTSRIAPIIFLVALFCHPSVAPVLFVLVVLTVSNSNFLYPLGILAVCVCVFILLPRSAYETEKMSAFLDLSRIQHSSFWIYLRNSVVKVYLLLLPIIGYVLYQKRRNALFIAISLGYTFAWIVLIAASEYQGTSEVLLENSMLPITAFWLILASRCLPPSAYMSLYTLACIVFFAGYILLLERKTYGPNTALQVKNITRWKTEQPSSNTFVLPENEWVANEKIMKNRTPVEYLLQSTELNNGHTFFVLPISYELPTNPEDVYLGPDLPIIKRAELNTHYFKPQQSGITP